ncbi:family 43 glycosylhydrolase [Siphonobacter sp. SORGH_AS_0500]|uniref:family 43 glycosylhydrolase n=1 Tax=Siphonobacter sp. SORGH_AS_0500 TaxID=1864824 RepID=UPI002861D7AB|nr:family 43 glycosylhydrolase [Siphonobacter sp. SORGH_AS_0500]MDR6197994.1 arabinoxylan arabinofuranohydrolase [Siphonobacter sp. SORGH_AS_0500]
MILRLQWLSFVLFMLIGCLEPTLASTPPKKEPNSAYLFVYFIGKGNNQEAIRFAVSKDGYNYKALNYNQPVIASEAISATGGVRDPHILRSEDGQSFYMVATDMHTVKYGWGPNHGMVLLKSKDLVNWESSKIDITKTYPEFKDVNRVWAPQTIYDPVAKKYMIYWSMRFGQDADKVYYAYANADFTALESAPKLLFTNPQGGSCIDADIINKDGVYHLFYKTEGNGNGIKQSTAKNLTGPYTQHDEYLQQTKDPVEGSGVFKLNNSDSYILMYDVYTKGRYEFTTSKDLKKFTKVDHEISMNFLPRHGTVLPITNAEYQALTQKWPLANNPILGGYYADPEILYAEKTGKFYLYPTSDGYHSWSGTSFKVFSSDNLVNWHDEGVILDLPKQTTWANRNAWAPCIVEKKINGKYKYFYFYSGAQKIGLATADEPTGPFTDFGKPFIDKHPKGVNGGQEIDPDVFTDPKTNKSYLYWGNGYMAVAELSDDLLSIKPETEKVITPDPTFREGTYVVYRKGTYYFFWSEDDTRSENYRVRYGTSKSPLGPITIPANNIVIEKDKNLGIYGTGHNSIIQIPGKDEWYIVYHRFHYPDGITMGDAAGYNRETCIDALTFNADGSIKKVQPTFNGIKPVSLKKKK